MKRLLLIAAFISCCVIVHSQKPTELTHSLTSYVDDFDDVFTPEQEKVLDGIIRSFKDTVQISLVTIKTFGEYDPADYVLQLGRRWGVGGKSNNGLLIVLSKTDHKMQVATGYGLEGDLPDSRVVSMQYDYAVPHFKEGDYYTGTKNLLIAYIKELSPAAKELRRVEEEKQEAIRKQQWRNFMDGVRQFLLWAGLAALILFSIYRIRRRKRLKEEAEALRIHEKEMERQKVEYEKQQAILTQKRKKLEEEREKERQERELQRRKQLIVDGQKALKDLPLSSDLRNKYRESFKRPLIEQYRTKRKLLSNAVEAKDYTTIAALIATLIGLLPEIKESSQQRTARLEEEKRQAILAETRAEERRKQQAEEDRKRKEREEQDRIVRKKREEEEEEERRRRRRDDDNSSYSSSLSSSSSSSSSDDSSSSFGGGSFGGGGGGSSW